MSNTYEPGFLADMNIVEYTNDLAEAKSPVGGGSAAGAALALALASAQKVAAIMSNRKKTEDKKLWADAEAEISDLRYHSLVLCEDDVRALCDLKELWKKDTKPYTQEERKELIENAMLAAEQMIEIAELLLQKIDEQLLLHAAKIVISDLGVAAALTEAAAKSALLNIQINHSLLMSELSEDSKMDAELDYSVYANSVERIASLARNIMTKVQEIL